jgi:pyruvate kinase
MFESMIENPKPTRAEASDVANAVLDGADAVMLSGETSVGKYPIIAVKTMDQIIRRAEARCISHFDIAGVPKEIEEKVSDAIGRSAYVLASEIRARAIAPLSHTGRSARAISKFRPNTKIIAVTSCEKTLYQLNLVWGIKGLLLKGFEKQKDFTFKNIRDAIKKANYVQKGDRIVITAGIPIMKKGRTNMVKVAVIE